MKLFPFFSQYTRRLVCALVLTLSILGSFATVAHGEYDPAKPELLTSTDLTAEAVILIEERSGEVIYEKNADIPMYPASTTKVMVAYLALMYGNMEQIVTISPTAMDVPSDSSLVPLALGQQVKFRDLLYAMMVTSGNEASNAIAETISGNIPNFVALMNKTAQVFGCTNTHFNNTHGYHDESHYTTARDMAIIAREAMKIDEFRKIAKTVRMTLPKDNLEGDRRLRSKNWFLQEIEGSESYYPYGTGIKTGTTDAAGECYVGAATKDDVSFISVVLNADSDTARFTDTIKLMEYGYAQISSVSIKELFLLNPTTVDVAYYADDDPYMGKLSLSLRLLSQQGPDTIVTTPDKIDGLSESLNRITTTEYTRSFDAPIKKDEVMGLLYYTNEKNETTTYEMVASRSVQRRENLAPTLEEIKERCEKNPNPFPRMSVGFVTIHFVLPGVLLFMLIRFILNLKHKGKKKQKRYKSVKPINRHYR